MGWLEFIGQREESCKDQSSSEIPLKYAAEYWSVAHVRQETTRGWVGKEPTKSLETVPAPTSLTEQSINS